MRVGIESSPLRVHSHLGMCPESVPLLKLFPLPGVLAPFFTPWVPFPHPPRPTTDITPLRVSSLPLVPWCSHGWLSEGASQRWESSWERALV